MLPIIIGMLALGYWIVWGIVMFFDLYLTHPALSLIMKISLWPVLLINIIGIALSVSSLIKGEQRHFTWFVGLLLNLLPVIGVGGFLGWLFWGFKM